MRCIAEFYFRLALLQAKPQDLSPSYVLQKILIGIYFSLSVLSSIALYGWMTSIILSLIDLLVLYVFSQLVLRNNKQRLHQTFNAFLGTGVIIGLLHSIFSYLLIENNTPQTISGAAVFLFLLIFLWLVVTYGHIVRHAADTSLSVGISISLGYIIFNAMILLSIAEMLKV